MPIGIAPRNYLAHDVEKTQSSHEFFSYTCGRWTARYAKPYGTAAADGRLGSDAVGATSGTPVAIRLSVPSPSLNVRTGCCRKSTNLSRGIGVPSHHTSPTSCACSKITWQRPGFTSSRLTCPQKTVMSRRRRRSSSTTSSSPCAKAHRQTMKSFTYVEQGPQLSGYLCFVVACNSRL